MTSSSTGNIIDGKAYARTLTDGLKPIISTFIDHDATVPCLAVILVGNNPASEVYVRNKGRTAERIGLKSIQHTLDAQTSQAALESLIDQLNADPAVHGILVQMPLPGGLDADAALDRVDPQKDVDGFHPVNAGRLATGRLEEALLPCTPHGCVLLAKKALGDDLSGQECVIVGRSTIVGRPAAQLFLAENATVTIAHSRTRELQAHVERADILVAAVGRAEFIPGEWVKPGATVIDVGINRLDPPHTDGRKLVGDVAFETASERAAHITPVPGGVGPMTIAMLMANTLLAAARQQGIHMVEERVAALL